jgi:hypothetical protein
VEGWVGSWCLRGEEGAEPGVEGDKRGEAESDAGFGY